MKWESQVREDYCKTTKRANRKVIKKPLQISNYILAKVNLEDKGWV